MVHFFRLVLGHTPFSKLFFLLSGRFFLGLNPSTPTKALTYSHAFSYHAMFSMHSASFVESRTYFNLCLILLVEVIIKNKPQCIFIRSEEHTSELQSRG